MLDTAERLREHDSFVELAAAAIAESATSREPVALLVGDVDHYGALAERQGADAARRWLDRILALACSSLRGGDIVAHGGGDEFVVLVKTSAMNAHAVAERLCTAVRMHAVADGSSPVTVSIGVAAAPEHGATYAALHAAADAARIRIKAQGRDGASLAPLRHHEALHRPLEVGRLAGRTGELRTLAGLLDDACAGNPRIAAILGELGTGTATLASLLESEVRLRGGSLVSGRCRARRVLEPYRVWSQVLRGLAQLHPAPEGTWSELPQLAPNIARADEPPGAGSKYRLLEELLEYLRRASRERPLVIVLDGMQWADAASWDALEYVVQQLGEERLLICLTQQVDPSFVEANERRQALAAHESFREVPVSRLTREEVKRWLEAVFHHQEVGREFLAFVYRHTEGNPLFLAEVLRTLLGEGALWYSGTRWEWTAVSELRLPANLPDLVNRRLSRFSASTLAVLSTAAIIGRDFDVGLVVAAGAGSEPAVQLALSEALAAGVIRRRHERNASGYSFAHDVVVEVLLRAVPPDRAAQQHGRIAEALARRGGDLVAVAVHYDLAAASAEAYRYAIEASERAQLVYADTTASELLEMAARNALTPAELAEVRVRLASLTESQGRYHEMEEHCELAIEWFEGQGDRARALTLRRMRERARLELGAPARQALEVLQALDEEARALGSDHERVAIGLMRSQAQQRLGDIPEAERIARECVELAERLGDAGMIVDSLTRLGRTMETDQPERAVEIYRTALPLAERAGEMRGQSRLHNNIGLALLHQGKWREARAAYARSIAIARAIGNLYQRATASVNLGLIAQRIGDLDTARQSFAEGMALAARIRNSEVQLYSLYNMGHVDWEAGNWADAGAVYETTASLARRIGADDVEIGATAALGLCYLEQGRSMEARRTLADVEPRVRSRSDWFQGREFPEALAIRVLLEDGFADSAVQRYRAALPMAEGLDAYSAVWLVLACAAELGRSAPAVLEESVRHYSQLATERGYHDAVRRLENIRTE